MRSVRLHLGEASIADGILEKDLDQYCPSAVAVVEISPPCQASLDLGNQGVVLEQSLCALQASMAARNHRRSCLERVHSLIVSACWDRSHQIERASLAKWDLGLWR